MAISFQCPQCQKAFKVKDELAGKKVACTQCKNIMVVPRPMVAPADAKALEDLANAALVHEEKANTNGSATHPVATADDVIAVECEFCFEPVQFPAAQAGRKAPCPSCRRIVTVPTPKVEKPKDWRSVDERPALARVETGPAPEGAWGNTQGLGGVVSREALLEAEVIVDRKTLAAPKRVWIWATLCVTAIMLIGVFWTLRTKKAADDQRSAMIELATKAADGKTDEGKAMPVGWPAVAYCAAGSFHLHESPPDLKKAASYFKSAKNAARKVENTTDRAELLLEILMAQTELFGDDAKVAAGEALPREEMQRELRQTLNMLREVPREFGWQAIESLTRRLGVAGGKEPLVFAVAPETLGGDGGRAEALAVVALTLMAQGEHSDKFITDIQTASGAASSPRVVALLVARKQLNEARSLLPESSPGDWRLSNRLAYAEGHARAGDWDRAMKIALDGGSPEDQSATLSLLADVAVDAKNMAKLDEITAAIVKHGKKFTLPAWAVDRTARACRRAGRADTARVLADGCDEPGIKPWAELQALQATLDGSNAPVAAEAAEHVGNKSVAQALAWMSIARHNVKLGGDAKSAIDAWTLPSARPLGLAGAAQGLQDRRKSK